MSPSELGKTAANGFPERLKRLIEQRGHSHRSLAEALGVSQQSVTNWTQGHTEPRLSHLRVLARELDLPLGLLLEEVDDREPIEAAAAASLLRQLTAQPVGPAMRSLAAATPDLFDLLSRAERYVQELDRRRDQS